MCCNLCAVFCTACCTWYASYDATLVRLNNCLLSVSTFCTSSQKVEHMMGSRVSGDASVLYVQPTAAPRACTSTAPSAAAGSAPSASALASGRRARTEGRKIAHQKSSSQKSSWIFSGMFKCLFIVVRSGVKSFALDTRGSREPGVLHLYVCVAFCKSSAENRGA